MTSSRKEWIVFDSHKAPESESDTYCGDRPLVLQMYHVHLNEMGWTLESECGVSEGIQAAIESA